MKISIGNSKLNRQLEDEKSLQKAFGNLAEIIYMRLQYLAAAENLADVSHLPPINRHLLKGNYKGCFAISVDKKYRIIFKPKGVPEETVTNLANIKEICIIAIENYH